MRQYSKTLLAHFENPKHVGELAPADNVVIAEEGLLGRSNVLRLSLAIEANRIVAACFKAYGCGVLIAVGALLTEVLCEKSNDALSMLSSDWLSETLAIPENKYQCAVMAERVLEKALLEAKERGLLQ